MPDDFAELREADRKRTQGEWSIHALETCLDFGANMTMKGDIATARWIGTIEPEDESCDELTDEDLANADFIRFASRDVPRLLAELDRLREIICQAESRMGPRAHHLGCECCGRNHEGQWTCAQLTQAIRAAVQQQENSDG